MPLRTLPRLKPRYIQEGDQLLADHPEVFMPFIEEFGDYLELAVLKATGHFVDPSAYPMSDAPENALEHVLLRRLESLPEQKKAIAAVNLQARLERMRILGENRSLTTHDLQGLISSPDPVFQAAAPLLHDRAQLMRELVLETAPAAEVQVPATLMSYQGNVRAILRIHRVYCIDETDPEHAFSSDEIALGGTAVHADGRTQPLTPFMVHNSMEDGSQQVYEPPILYAHYDIVREVDNSAYPKYICCFLVLTEVDNGGMPEFLDELYKEVKSKVEAAVTAWATGAVGPLGPVIAVTTGKLLDRLWDLFRTIWEDDPFPPAKLDLLFRAPRANFNGSDYSPMYAAYFTGHGGSYQVDYSWQIAGRADWVDDPPANEPVVEEPSIEGIVIYKNVNYDGDQKLLKKGIHRLGGGPIQNGQGRSRFSPFNEEIDSIQVGRNYYAWLFKTPDMTGPFLEIRADTPYFDNNWRDQISSIIVFRKE